MSLYLCYYRPDHNVSYVFVSFFYSGTVKMKKRAFTRLILDTAYSFFLPPFSFQIRVGGLYLLYSLHGCQTAVPPEQVRYVACGHALLTFK